MERRRETRRGKAAARLVHSSLSSASAFIEISVHQGQWLGDPQEVLELDTWNDQKAILAAAPGFDGWYPVTGAWHWIAQLRREFGVTGEGPGDDPRKLREDGFFELGLMLVGIAENALIQYSRTQMYSDFSQDSDVDLEESSIDEESAMRVTIAPNGEWWAEVGSEAFEALNNDLVEAGLDSRVQTPRNNMYAEGGIVIDQLVDVSFFLWNHVPSEIVSSIVALAVERLYVQVRHRVSSDGRGRPIGTIYGSGPDEILSRFYLDTGEPVEEPATGVAGRLLQRVRRGRSGQ
jgi:hypothetical protein